VEKKEDGLDSLSKTIFFTCSSKSCDTLIRRGCIELHGDALISVVSGD
jgi:hypothetical protein